jgi:hypothetical protein
MHGLEASGHCRRYFAALFTTENGQFIQLA